MEQKEITLWFYNFMSKHKINQKQMADKLGVNQAYVSSMVRGKKYLTTKIINKLVCLWGMTPKDYEFLQQHTMSKEKLLKKKIDELENQIKKLKENESRKLDIKTIKNYTTDNLYLKLPVTVYLRFIEFLDSLEGKDE